MDNQLQKQFILPLNFGLKTQNYLKYFLIFTAWPVINIGFSITLFLFYFMLIEIKKKTKSAFLKIDSNSIKFYIFVVISFLSLMFAPWEKINLPVYSDIQLQVQYLYWILVAVFFMNTYKFMNKDEVNKYIFIGLFLHTIHFFFFNFSTPIPLFRAFVSRNSFIYNFLSLWPLASGYIYKRFGNLRGNLSLILVFLIMLFTDGRSGAVIILIENLLIYIVFNKSKAQIIRITIVILIPLLSILGPLIVNDENKIALGNAITPLSSRVGDFIKGEGVDGDLTFDKSWLTRKLMIDKGLEIVTDYPFFGIGIGHFSYYSAELKSYNSIEYIRLVGSFEGDKADEVYFNAKSAHNSYVNLASEMGLIGFLSLITILFPILLLAIWKMVVLTINYNDLIFISLIGICIHFYAISSLPGTVTWFIFGLASSRRINEINN